MTMMTVRNVDCGQERVQLDVHRSHVNERSVSCDLSMADSQITTLSSRYGLHARRSRPVSVASARYESKPERAGGRREVDFLV